MSASLSPRLGPDYRMSPEYKAEVAKKVGAWLELVSPKEPYEIDAPIKGLEGLEKADSVLREQGVAGFLIAGVLGDLWSKDSVNKKSLAKHKDVDVVVLDPEFRLEKRWQYGIDWFSPKKEGLMSAGYGFEYMFKAGPPIVLNYKIEQKEKLDPGLWIPDAILYSKMRFVEASVYAARDSAFADVLSEFCETIEDGLNYHLPSDSELRNFMDGRVVYWHQVTFEENFEPNS